MVSLYQEHSVRGFMQDGLTSRVGCIVFKANLHDKPREEALLRILDNTKIDSTDFYDVYIEQDKVDRCAGIVDRHGKLVFDNDFIKRSWFIYKVQYDKIGMCWKFWHKEQEFPEEEDYLFAWQFFQGMDDKTDFEIVGNTRQNPELKIGPVRD